MDRPQKAPAELLLTSNIHRTILQDMCRLALLHRRQGKEEDQRTSELDEILRQAHNPSEPCIVQMDTLETLYRIRDEVDAILDHTMLEILQHSGVVAPDCKLKPHVTP